MEFSIFLVIDSAWINVMMVEAKKLQFHTAEINVGR